jgi:translocation and assembly module TamA
MNITFYRLLITTLIVVLHMSNNVQAIEHGNKKNFQIEIKINNQNTTTNRDLVKLTTIIKTQVDNIKNPLTYWQKEGKSLLYKLFYAHGYYSSVIKVSVPNQQHIIFYISLLQRYTISKIYLKHNNINLYIPNKKNLQIYPGQFAIAKKILATEKEVIKYLQNNNYFPSSLVTHHITINHFKHTIKITFLIHPNHYIHISQIDFNDLHKTTSNSIKHLKHKQHYNKSPIAKTYKTVQKNKLFSSINPIIFTPDNISKNLPIPIILNINKHKLRVLKTNLVYNPISGLNTSLYWTHKNIFQNGQKVEINVLNNLLEKALAINYINHFYKHREQVLKLGTKTVNKQKYKASYNKIISSSISLERKLGKMWRTGISGKLIQNKYKQNKTSSLLSLPLYLIINKKNDTINPTKGFVLKIIGGPYWNKHFSPKKNLIKMQLSSSNYLSLKKQYNPILATNITTNNIMNFDTNKSFYIQKVRMQETLSLRGCTNNISSCHNKLYTKYTNLIKTNTELRYKITKRVGIVTFLDSGIIYASRGLNKNYKLYHGAGFGLRYLTNLGLIRLDIAYPIQDWKCIGNLYQLYFGIGQIF